MATSKVIPLRSSQANHERWKEAASARNMSFNMWAIRALQAQAELDEAEFAEKAERIAQRELLKKTTFPQESKRVACRHVSKGQWCYVCNSKRW